MSSSISSGALTRSRSLRKPTANINNNNNINVNTTTGPTDQDDASVGNVRDGPRPLSPTRLPVKGGLPTTRTTSRNLQSFTAGGLSSASSSSSAAAAAAAATPPTRQPSVRRTARPLSGILGRPAPVSREDSSGGGGGGGGGGGDVLNNRPPRTASTRVPITGQQGSTPSSSSSMGRPLTRSGSVSSRPTTSSGLPSSTTRPSRLTSGHGRTKSSITTLTGATTLRPPSQTSADSGSSGGVGGSTGGSTAIDRSRPPITSSNNTRSAAAAHRRNISTTSTTASTLTASRQPTSSSSKPPISTRQPSSRQPQPPSSTSPTEHPTTRDRSFSSSTLLPPSSSHHHRPAFTTLQQHYSPAKSLAPKPLTSSYLAPPSPSKLPTNVAISAETSRLQTELLQLHLLHRDAQDVAAQWRSSARGKLEQRFREVVKVEGEVGKLEEGMVEEGNLLALRDWDSGGENVGDRGNGLEGRIQMLDEVVCGLWTMGELGGRYARVVRRFEKWVERVREVDGKRRRFDEMRTGGGGSMLGGEGPVDSSLLMGEGKETLLDAGWKDECALLARRLDEWQRMLKGLTLEESQDSRTVANVSTTGTSGEDKSQSSSSSSLARILGACHSLVHDMLAELSLMELMEREAVAAENAWVRAVNRDEDQGGRRGAEEETAGRNAARAGAIWRGF